MAVERKIEYGVVAVGAPFEKALHLKNVGQAPAVFTFEARHVPPGCVISPQRGSVGPGGTQEVTVEYTAPKSQLVEATLVAEVRCGKPVKLVMAALGMGDEGGGGASSEPLKCFCLGCGDYLGAVAFGTLTQGVRI